MGTNASTHGITDGAADGGGASGKHVYLAGYEVFFLPQEVEAMSQKKKALCERHGLVGHFPGGSGPSRGRPRG